MSRKYLIRLDDACPTMHRNNWERMESLLDAYGVRPLVGVIASNMDPAQHHSPENKDFWEKVKQWEDKGWAVAMHGLNHILDNSEGGLNPIWKKSEFVGKDLSAQKEKIRNASKIFESHGLHPSYFFAPCHTFDQNTLRALREESDIRIVSDTIALRPYRSGDFTFIPQIGGKCRKMPLPGVFTFCFHPSTMKPEDFDMLERFMIANKEKMESFKNLDLSRVKSKSLVDRALSSLYFGFRKAKAILKG